MNTLKFKISSALKDLIGKDLITSDNVAIFELVKNSYDAFAKNVVITFADDKIIIADNGKGMSLDDLKDKWLFLAYSGKKDGSEDAANEKQKSYRDKIKRYYAGAKGVGRFSCDRLGQYLTITTKTESTNAEQIKVNWAKFEIDQMIEFKDVEVEHNSILSPVVFPKEELHGTIIEITGLHDKNSPWTREHILELKLSLQKLINPFSETSDFVIEINCERELFKDKRELEGGNGYDKDIVNGPLKNSIIKILKLKTTQIDVSVNDEYIITTLSDRGIDIYKIKERNLQFPLITNGNVSLSFLNRAAKYNFTRIMGVESKNYGSIFLFRNGFRILPFGEIGDDSWGVDYRAQQGRARYLGTRDLIGRVDIYVNNTDELKEVSSRDSGLVDTPMSRQVYAFFTQVERRLERYVAGVLWGESFLKNDYYGDAAKGDAERKKLQQIDKDSDKPNYVLDSSLGSKIDFVRLIKTLSSDNNVTVLYYNTELANIVSPNFATEDIKPQFLLDLETIAERTGNDVLISKIDEAKRQIEILSHQKQDAERKAEEAERLRHEAEEKAAQADLKRQEAEERAKAEEEQRRQAEVAKLKAENAKAKAEIERLVAEKKAKDEEDKRKKAEKVKDQVEKQNLFLQSVDSLDKDRIVKYHHDIRLHAGTIQNTITTIIKKINKHCLTDQEMIMYTERIKRANNKVLSIAMFASKANFNTEGETIENDIIQYIEQYVTDVLPDFFEEIKFHCKSNGHSLIRKFKPLEVSLFIDNLVSNSINAHAKNLNIDTSLEDNHTIISIYDDGRGWSSDLDSRDAFEKGVSTTSGSGLGLFNAKDFVQSTLNGQIKIDYKYNSGILGKPGVMFKIVL